MTGSAIRIPVAKPLIGEEEKRAVMAVLETGQIAEGPQTKVFEEDFARATGVEHAIAVSNGTVALHLALMAGGVKPGDEVAVPAFSFVATANAVLMAGATPVFVDVDPVTFNMDPRKLKSAMTPRTKAVMPVHLFGHPADMDVLSDVAAARGAILVGDAAQAIGARYKGKPVGATAVAEAFSLYPTKNVTTGEGGVVTTNDAEIAALARSLRNHGRGIATLGTYDHIRLGWNYRLTDLAAAIGIEQLKKLTKFNEARRYHAELLTRRLKNVASVTVPTEASYAHHAFHQYTLRVLGHHGARERLQAFLRERGIGSGVYYPKPLHAYPHLAAYGHADLKVSEQLAREVISLPIHPALTAQEVAEVASAVEEWAIQQE